MISGSILFWEPLNFAIIRGLKSTGFGQTNLNDLPINAIADSNLVHVAVLRATEGQCVHMQGDRTRDLVNSTYVPRIFIPMCQQDR
jgi:hypothetical protein